MTGSEFIAAVIMYCGPGWVGALLWFIDRRMIDISRGKDPGDYLYLTPGWILLGFAVSSLFGPIIFVAAALGFVVGAVMLVLRPKWWVGPLFHASPELAYDRPGRPLPIRRDSFRAKYQ